MISFPCLKDPSSLILKPNQNSIMRIAILLSLVLASHLIAAPIPEDAYDKGIAIGCQAYSFKEFSAFEAIAKTKEAGGEIIEFYPGQKLRPDSPKDEVVSHHAGEEVITALLAECKRQGIHPVNYGVVKANNPDEVQKIMAFAKKMGPKGVVVPAGQGVVDVAACIEELKKQNFKGHFSIEHENDWKNSVPKIKESIEFTKAEWAK